MTPDTLRTLSANPPPSRWRFSSVNDAMNRVWELEDCLSITRSLRTVNIRLANERVEALETKMTSRTLPPVEAATAAIATASAIAQQNPAVAAPSAIVAAYNAITHPIDRTEFYRANKSAIDRAYRNAPDTEPRASFAKTGISLVDQMADMDPIARTMHYRKNKSAIDAAYKNIKS